MGQPHADTAHVETHVTVRYWASAKAAAGVAEEALPVEGTVRLADLRAQAVARHRDAPGLERVLAVCSALVDGTPVGSSDPGAGRFMDAPKKKGRGCRPADFSRTRVNRR